MEEDFVPVFNWSQMRSIDVSFIPEGFEGAHHSNICIFPTSDISCKTPHGKHGHPLDTKLLAVTFT